MNNRPFSKAKILICKMLVGTMLAYGTGPILAYDIGSILNGVIIPLYRRPSAADGRKPAIDAGPISGQLSVSDWVSTCFFSVNCLNATKLTVNKKVNSK